MVMTVKNLEGMDSIGLVSENSEIVLRDVKVKKHSGKSVKEYRYQYPCLNIPRQIFESFIKLAGSSSKTKIKVSVELCLVAEGKQYKPVIVIKPLE